MNTTAPTYEPAPPRHSPERGRPDFGVRVAIARFRYGPAHLHVTLSAETMRAMGWCAGDQVNVCYGRIDGAVATARLALSVTVDDLREARRLRPTAGGLGNAVASFRLPDDLARASAPGMEAQFFRTNPGEEGTLEITLPWRLNPSQSEAHA